MSFFIVGVCVCESLFFSFVLLLGPFRYVGLVNILFQDVIFSIREKRAKKSGAGSRRLGKRQKQEEDQLSNSMKKYFSGERSITADEGGSGDNSTHVDIDVRN